MRQRGFTFMGFLIAVAVAAGIFWCVTYGPIYVENFEVKSILRESANLCYRESNDEKIKDFFMVKLARTFSEEVMDHGVMQHRLKFDADREEIRIERTETPLEVNMWFTYHRTVTIPLLGGEREVIFVDHAYQDLSPVKW
jgi:hypothetical protein